MAKDSNRTEHRKKIFLFGSTSLVGWNLLLEDQKEECVPFCNPYTKLRESRDWQRLRLENREDYRTLFAQETPAVLIHCGGICDVDKCEKNPKWAYQLNVLGLEFLLEFLPETVRLLYISSDHVFGGGSMPYHERSQTTPISVYGRTRVSAEERVMKRKNSLILRAGLPIGSSADRKTGHLNWLQYRKKKGLPLTIVKDEFRSVVWAKDLAHRIFTYARSSICGLRHISAQRTVSRLELAKFLDQKYRIGARFSITTRDRQHMPHLGRVELSTLHKDIYAKPLPGIL